MLIHSYDDDNADVRNVVGDHQLVIIIAMMMAGRGKGKGFRKATRRGTQETGRGNRG